MNTDMILKAKITLKFFAAIVAFYISFTKMNHKMTFQCGLVYKPFFTICAGVVPFLCMFAIVTLQLERCLKCNVA